jgi:hypothetical protein
MRAMLLAGALALAATGAGHGAPIGPVSAIHVSVGPKLQARASVYGQREVEFLQNDLECVVQQALEASNLTGPGGARLELTLVDATASLPTFKEMSDRPGLQLLSPRLGGATLEGELVYPDGHAERVSYRWYESDFSQVAAATTWSDAQQTFDDFARDLVRGRAFRRG